MCIECQGECIAILHKAVRKNESFWGSLGIRFQEIYRSTRCKVCENAYGCLKGKGSRSSQAEP